MNILILGQNDINESLIKCLKEQGFETAAADVSAVKSFSGEYGDFRVKIGEGVITACAVIVTEPAEKQPESIGGGAPCSIFDDSAIKKISESGTKTPVVVLLDYFNESSPAAALKALKEAAMLAKKKYNVVFLSRFVRTPAMETEELYLKVRNAGVTFIKYESIKISHETGPGLYNIEVSDGVNDVSLSAKYIAADCGYGVSDKFTALVKKLRLVADETGHISEDKYFLAPVLTGRKGVYFLGRNTCADRLWEGIDYIVSEIGADFSGDKDYAVIDGEKCAFCYTCYRACPHAAMEPDEVDRVMKNREEACDGCGICATVCPGNAVTMAFDNFAEAAAPGKSGKVKIFCCENSGGLVLANIMPGLGELAGKIDCETVACGGRIGFEQLSGALRLYGKVVLLVCMDDACRHFDGNKRACLQAERLSAMLEKAGADKNRVFQLKTSHAMANVAADDIRDIIMGGEL
jgi:Pyruvate/2-oxoacid:ferredoxin oxidoreductase delta subunit/coenzyme F420-reducing hydrogenase delta subunit